MRTGLLLLAVCEIILLGSLGKASDPCIPPMLSVVEELQPPNYYREFDQVATNLSRAGYIVRDETLLLAYVRGSIAREPFKGFDEASFLSNVFQTIKRRGVMSQDNIDAIYDVIVKNKLYPQYEAELLAEDTNAMAYSYFFKKQGSEDATPMKAVSAEVLRIVPTLRDDGPGKHTLVLNDSSGREIKSLPVPSGEDFHFPQSHSVVDRDALSLEFYVGQKQKIILAKNDDGLIVIWSSDSNTPWHLSATMAPMLSNETRMPRFEELRRPYVNHLPSGLLSLSEVTLYEDGKGVIYLTANSTDGQYKSGRWKMYQLP